MLSGRGYQAGNNLRVPSLASIPIASYDARVDMHTVTVSPKYQVVIPQAIRESLKLAPGEKLRVLEFDGRVELIPIRSLKSMRGFLRGMDTGVLREEDRV